MASANAHINIRVDGDIKNKAQDVFSSLGLDMTSAINIFLRQAIRKNGLPFDVVNDPPRMRNIPPQLGCLKEQIKETDGHNWFEPMEEFEEYM